MTSPAPGGPASDFVIAVDSVGVTCTWRERRERIAWAAIDEIAILTTDDGPAGIDVWLALTGPGHGCLVPDEAPGYKQLLFTELRERFPGMDWSKLTEAMSHTDVASFVLWRRGTRLIR
jgi:hypothetical protein